jgi:two-component system response regulator AtoC
VRELENVINRAQILAEGSRITLADLPEDITRAGTPISAAGGNGATEGSLREQMRRVEFEIIARALEEAGGDRRVVAQRLGIGLSSLYRKIEDFERMGFGDGPHAASAAYS